MGYSILQLPPSSAGKALICMPSRTTLLRGALKQAVEVRPHRTEARVAMSSMAGPSRGPARDALFAKDRDAMQADKRGFPDRSYTTRILPIRSSAIRFSGKGKEPMRSVHVEIDGQEDAQNLDEASHALQQSHLVAFPTETVYGLAGNALDASAAGKIFSAKGRPADNPLIVHIADMDMMDMLVKPGFALPSAYTALVDAFWPGPLTILVPANTERVPSVVRCGLDTLGVRMPLHAVARALIATSGLPLAAPSANVSGRPSPTTAMHVHHDMTTTQRAESSVQGANGVHDTHYFDDSVQGRIPYIVDGGPSLVGLESTVVDGVTCPGELRILRPGGVSVEEIEQTLRRANLLVEATNGTSDIQENNRSDDRVRVRVYGKDMAKNAEVESNPTTPGMKYRHYSPDAEVVLLMSVTKGLDAAKEAAQDMTNGQVQTASSRDVQIAVQEQIALCRASRQGRPINVGLMSMDDTGLTSVLLRGAERNAGDARLWKPTEHSDEQSGKLAYTLHGFSLGTTSSPAQAAHRLFDGLRTLDRGSEAASRCDLIFVEAPVNDSGVGLAILNRIQKAASRSIAVTVP